MQQVVASVLAEQERSQFADQAISKSLPVRFKALRRFYKLADSEIKRAGLPVAQRLVTWALVMLVEPV